MERSLGHPYYRVAFRVVRPLLVSPPLGPLLGILGPTRNGVIILVEITPTSTFQITLPKIKLQLFSFKNNIIIIL